jgi:HSP20 family protein
MLPAPERFASMMNWFEDEMEGAVAKFFGEDGGALSTERFLPRTDMVESETGFEVTVDLPGLKPEEVSVEIRNGNLWISGKREEEEETKERTYHRLERRHGEFRRVLSLPTAIEESKVEAKFENGVLRINLPKSEVAKPRHIEVKA